MASQAATEIANITYDTIMNGDFSYYETTIRQYMQAGMSEEEAKHEAAKVLGGQVGEAAMSGGVVGLILGGIGGVSSYHNSVATGNRVITSAQVENLVELGKTMPPESRAYILAEELENTTPTAAKVGALYAEIQTELSNMEDPEQIDRVSSALAEIALAPAVQSTATDAVATEQAVPTMQMPPQTETQPTAPTMADERPNLFTLTKGAQNVDSAAQNAAGGDSTVDAPTGVGAENTRENGRAYSENGIPAHPRSVAELAGKAYTNEDTARFKSILGYDVYVYDGVKGAERAFTDGKAIYINLANTDVETAVVVHELTHILEGTEEYNAYQRYILQSAAYQSYLRAQNGLTHEELLSRKIAALKKAGKSGDLRRQALREIVADFTGNYLVHDEAHLAKLAQQNPSLFRRLWNAVRQAWHQLLAKLGMRDAESHEMQAMEAMFRRAYAAARTQKSPANESGVRYMVDNRVLTDDDAEEYMRVGKKLKTRHKKENMLRAGKNPVLTSINDVKEFIRNAIHGKAAGEVKAYAVVGKKLSDAVEEKYSGLELYGRYIELEADGLREAYKQHYTPKESGDISLTEADFESIPDILNNFDYVIGIGVYKGRIQIHLAKENADGFVKLLTVVSGERNSIIVTKLVGNSKEKFYKNYGKKIERDTGSLRSLADQSADSNPLTTAQHTAGTLSTTIIPDSPENSNTKFSLSDDTDSDTAYMDAVECGDMETAQRMVDEAAEKAFANSKIRDENGRLLKVYHGSDAKFTVFDKTKGRTSMDIQGMFFSPWEDDAAGYGQDVRAFYLNIQNPADEATGYRALRKYQRENNAGVKAREELQRFGYDGVNNEEQEYIVFEPNQIKSADPVTYDDNGNVIPLSQRFNNEENDIRYSLDDVTEDAPSSGEDATAAKRPFTPKPMSEETKKAWDDADKAMHSTFTEEQYRQVIAAMGAAEAQGVDLGSVPPKDPDMSPSLYIEKTLADPTVPDATKEWLQDNPQMFAVIHNAELNALAREILERDGGMEEVWAKVATGQTVQSHEMRALQVFERMQPIGEDAGRAVIVSALAARRAGQLLSSIKHGHAPEVYEKMDPEHRRLELVANTTHDAIVDTVGHVHDFIDAKYHRGAGAMFDEAALAFDTMIQKDKSILEGGYFQIGKAAAEAVDGVEDTYAEKKARKNENYGTRIKTLMAHHLKNKAVQEALAEELENGTSPLDAFRTVLARKLHIRFMTTDQTEFVQQCGHRIGTMMDEMYRSDDYNARQEKLVEIDAEKQAMEKYVAEHLTATGFDLLNSWRKFAMLANVRTHIRNMSSNVVQQGIKSTDDVVAQGLERTAAFFMAKLGKEQPSLSRTVAWRATKHGKNIRETVDWMADMVAKNMQVDLGYDNDGRSKAGGADNAIQSAHMMAENLLDKGSLAMARPLFGKSGNILNRLSDLNSRLLEKEDMFFFKRTFADELGQRMTAQKVEKPTQTMINEATNAALYAVFRADNMLSKVFSAMKTMSKLHPEASNNSNAQFAFKTASEFIDVVLPFTKTPSNLLLNALDHSPVGFIMTTAKLMCDRLKSHNNTMTTADICQAYARNITGTGIMALGVLLVRLGVLTVFEDDDDEYNELSGNQEFSLKLFGHEVSIDWLQPSATPLLMGAAAAEALQSEDVSMLDVVQAMGKVLFDQSYLQSIQQTFDTSDYADGNYLGEAARNAFTSWVGQMIPTAIGQLARAVDPTQRKVWDGWRTPLNTALSRIPGASYLLEPKVDVWGEDVQRSNDGVVANATEQFVNPASVETSAYADDSTTITLVDLWEAAKERQKEIKSDDTLTEAEREDALKEVNTGSIFNDGDVEKGWMLEDGSRVVDDEDLTDEVTRIMRRTFKAYADVLVESDEFQNADMGEQIDMLGDMYSGVTAFTKDILEEMSADQATDIMEAYLEEIKSGNYDPNVVDALASVELADGAPLVSNHTLASSYRGVYDSVLEGLKRKQGNVLEYTEDGEDVRIVVNRATAEELAIYEEKMAEKARKACRNLYGWAEPDELVELFDKHDPYRVYVMLKERN